MSILRSTVVAKILQMGGTLSGSRAFGTPQPDSDWDYYLSNSKIGRYKRWLTRMHIQWDSCFIGTITCWPEGDQVEVSFLFPRTRKEHERIKLRLEDTTS